MPKVGTVYLVGAGPGDPDLLTQRAVNLLSSVDSIVHDRLIPPLALLTIRPDARLIDVGKSPTKHRRSQDEINQILVKEAKAGRSVVRLKGGDCFVFGRGGEEAIVLAEAGIPFEVVPGVTSSIAVPAYAAIPVTHRGISTEFAVVTGHEDPAKPESTIDWEHLAKGVGTCVFLMGVKNLQKIVNKLLEFGRAPETPAAIIYRGCSSAQKVLEAPLAELPKHPEIGTFKPPSITVIGNVVALRKKLGPWFEKLPLHGLRFLCTRPIEQGGRELAMALVRLGAEPILSPLIEVTPRENVKGLVSSFCKLSAREYSWTIFTSANGVHFFFDELDSNCLDSRAFGGCRLATIGPATADALDEYGLRSDLIPRKFTAEGLLAALPMDLTDQRVLLPRAAQARPTLVEGLNERGATVDEVHLYDTTPAQKLSPEAEEAINNKLLDAILLFSPSAADAYHELTKERDERPPAVAIGPITGARARELGIDVIGEAKAHTAKGLLDALCEVFAK